MKDVRKRLRLSGKLYTSSEGKSKPPKQMKSGCGSGRFKCSTNVSNQQRQSIYPAYWELTTYQRQRDFLCYA